MLNTTNTPRYLLFAPGVFPGVVIPYYIVEFITSRVRYAYSSRVADLTVGAIIVATAVTFSTRVWNV